VGAAVVVFVGEGIEVGLEVGEGLGGGLLDEPAFEGLLEAFDFPAGGGMVGAGVLVGDPEVGQGGLEGVAAAAPAGEAAGVDEGVVGQHGGGRPCSVAVSWKVPRTMGPVTWGWVVTLSA
jgi:hypothetical protein